MICYQHLEFGVTLPLDESSVPWDFSLSACKLSEEISMCVTIDCHALDATIGLTLIGIEEAARALVMEPLYSIEYKLTGNHPWNTECRRSQ